MTDEVTITATDVSGAALQLAVENAVGHGVADRITFFEVDLLPPLAGIGHDVIVSNLPYVATPDLEAAGPALAHEPRVALDGGPDGTAVIERLIGELATGLAPGGAAFLEIGAGQAEAVRAIAARALPEAEVAIEPDLAGTPRVVRIDGTG